MDNNYMDYFDLNDGLNYYKTKAGEMYAADDPAANWWKATRKKLEYLIDLLSDRIGIELVINYSERPNAQAGRGRIEFKDYVITGCKPKNVESDYLFIKLAFHSLFEKTQFDIEIDGNWKLKGQIYSGDDISDLNYNSSFTLPINQDFPKNWDELLNTITEPFDNAVRLFLQHNEKVKIDSKKKR